LWQQAKGLDVPAFTEHARKSVAASCWIESEYESAAMWGLYTAAKEGVAVDTSFKKLDELVATKSAALAAAEVPSVAGVARVRYVDHFSDGLLQEGGPLNAFAPFMLKTSAMRTNVKCAR
jgi:hypothetical protein